MRSPTPLVPFTPYSKGFANKPFAKPVRPDVQPRFLIIYFLSASVQLSAMSSPIQALVIPVTPFRQNAALVWCVASRRAAFIDPGGEAELLLEAARQAQVEVEKVLLTHGHVDHAGAAAELKERLKVPIEGPHPDEEWLLESIEQQGARFGMFQARPCAPDRWLQEGDHVLVGETAFAVFHCPGHTPGHIVFFQPEARFAFVGDVIFRGSIGRTDLPRGNHAALISSIRDKLFPLGDDVGFQPGHGERSTFGWERKTNPFVSDLAVGGGVGP